MDFRKATIEDLDVLVTTRIEVLRAANKLGADVDMSEVARQSRAYYSKALIDNTHRYYSVSSQHYAAGCVRK